MSTVDGWEFHPDPPPHTYYFWNSNYSDYFRTAGMSSRGSFKPLLETACIQGVESNWRRVTRLKDSRGYFNSKILGYFKNFKLREGVSSKNSYYFWNSRIQDYFKTAGMSSRGSFITLRETVCIQGVETISWRVTDWKDSRGYSNSKNRDYFRIAGISIWRGFRVKWNSRFLENFQG